MRKAFGTDWVVRVYPAARISSFRDIPPFFSCMAVSGTDTPAICFGCQRPDRNSGVRKSLPTGRETTASSKNYVRSVGGRSYYGNASFAEKRSLSAHPACEN
jgi:hypothetical protein